MTPVKKTLILFAFVLAFVAVFTACESEPTHKHKWEWKITLEPTTSAPGLATETCTKCGATRGTEEIPQLPLPPLECECNGVLEDCICGVDCECEICEHLPPPDCGCNNADDCICEENCECENCGFIPPPPDCECNSADDCNCGASCGCENCVVPGGPVCPPHTYGEWKIKAAATCTTTGERERICSICQYVDTETIPINSSAHNAGPWVTVTQPIPYCTTAEKKELHCILCNVLLDSETIPAPGHDWKWVVTLEPTESTAGLKTETCARTGCGATSGNTEVIPQLPGPLVPVSITLPATVETMGANTFCKSGTFTANQTVTWSLAAAGSLEGTSINPATGALAVNIADHGKTVTITAASPTNPSNSASKTITVVSCLPSDFYGEWWVEEIDYPWGEYTVIINAGNFKFLDDSDGYVYFSIDDWTAELNATSYSPDEYPAGYYLSVTAIEQVDNYFPSLAAYILIYLNNDGQKLMSYIEDTPKREYEKVNSGTAYLTHITAVYNGTATIDASTPLNNLKNNLTVTAHYSDNTTGIIAAGNYTLDGTLVAPTSEITVRYGGETYTFSVNVTNVQTFPPIAMVLIGNGSFEMGKKLGNGAGGDVTPTHQVTLTENFYMGKYEVTQKQYQAVMGSLPDDLISHSYGKGDDYPVYYVSWYEAIVFCNKLSMMEGLTPAYSISSSTNPAAWGAVPRGNSTTWNAVVCDWNAAGYRLPTEAQWEYAAKGGNPLAPGWVGYTYAGSDTIGNVAWYTDNSGSTTHVVGTKSPNGLGLYDMTGNVTEWCWDRSGNYTNEAVENPKGAATGNSRVWRNGGMFAGAAYCRSVDRGSDYPYFIDYDQGFRVSRPAP